MSGTSSDRNEPVSGFQRPRAPDCRFCLRVFHVVRIPSKVACRPRRHLNLFARALAVCGALSSLTCFIHAVHAQDTNAQDTNPAATSPFETTGTPASDSTIPPAAAESNPLPTPGTEPGGTFFPNDMTTPANVPVPQGIATSPGIPTAQGIAATQGAASTGYFQSHGIFGFRLEGSSQNMYNDNFRDLPSSAKLTNGATRSDFITTNSIDGYGTADVSRQQFFVLGSFGQVNYLKNNQFDGNPLSFAGGINWQVTSRCSGDLQSGIATRQQSDFAQLSTPVVNTVQTVNYEAHGLCNIGHEYSISLQGQRQESVNSNAALQLANLDQNRAKTKLLYGQPSVGSLGAEFAYVGSNYPARSLMVTEYDAGAVMEGRLFQKTHFSAEFGIARISSGASSVGLGSGTPGTSYKPYIDASAVWTPTAKTSLRVGLDHRVTNSTSVVSTFATTSTASVAGTWTISPKMSAFETFSYSIIDYSGGSSTTVAPATFQQTGKTREAINVLSLNYKFTQILTFNLQYLLTTQSSSQGRSFTSNAALLGLRLVY